MPANYANKPTSKWDHSHALAEGDELTDANTDAPITVEAVNEDGSVIARVWLDQRHGQEYDTEEWTESQTTTGLADGIIETVDGKSNELATF